jgi:thiamine biosynthesis lipoprotein
MQSPSPWIERARPLLGTTVSIRVQGLSERDAHAAIDEAFSEIALVHRLMSFQESESEISRLNRDGFGDAQVVHAATFEVLRWAAELAENSAGCFDITMARALVASRLLGVPHSRYLPDAQANWRDIELSEDCRVRFRRPLWIDVSGIAKGYAVDRAIETLKRHRVAQAAVNAGGDLCVFGPEPERVSLRTDHSSAEGMPVLDIQDAAVASSSTSHLPGAHADPKSGEAVPADRFACVVAQSCLIADALTKPVLILQDESEGLLRRYGAVAHLHDRLRGWRHLPEQAG